MQKPPDVLTMTRAAVEYRHGALYYRACPHCGGALRWRVRQRDLTHDRWWRCYECGWRMWEHEMPADIRRRYGIEVA